MTADRIRVWLMIVFLALITLGSFWVWELMRRNAENKDANNATRTHPDYFVEDFNFIRLSKNGESSYRMSGKSLTHYPRDDEYKIIDPHIIGFDKNRNPINLRANSAVAQQQVRDEVSKEINDEIHLFGDVTFERQENGNVKPLHLLSPYLLFLPNKKIIKSDQEITITSIGTNIHAVGLLADYANDKFQLLSHVNINIDPQIKYAKKAN
jgi:lipopolysaccharide export system protein LptC